MTGPSIRSGTEEDAPGISALVCALSAEFIVGDFPAAAQAGFLRDHSEAKVRERLSGDYRFYVAEHKGNIAGVAAIRANTHLYYLFVAKSHQRAGLARRLWSRLMADSLALGNPGRFTVNASGFAIPAYEKLGFRRAGPIKEKDGVLFSPMALVVPGDAEAPAIHALHVPAVRAFFEDFVAAFATFSGPEIARRYVAPYLAIRSDGSSEVFGTADAIGTYFQRIVDDYRARGVRYCRYRDLAVIPMGSAAALGTVTWALCRDDGSIVAAWTESYTLVLVEGRMKAAASVDHAVRQE